MKLKYQRTEILSILICEISGFHGGKYENDNILGYSTE
jgi:hypothetical protein